MIVCRLFAFGASAGLHLMALAAATWLITGVAPPRISPKKTSAPTVVVVSPVDAFSTAPKDQAGPTPRHPIPHELGIRLQEGASRVSIDGFTFDFSKVVGRAADLFPFLTGRAALDLLVAPSREQGRGSLLNPFSPSGRQVAQKPPLALSDRGLQWLLDSSWSRRERWQAFQRIAERTRAYSPSEGRLPDLLRGYGVQNGLQPFVDTRTRDPRLWSQLGIAADHADFIDFVGQFASGHPSTKVTTELLLLLDKLAQGSLDALTTLIETEPPTELAWTRDANRPAYEAIVAIRRHYLLEVQRRGLTRPEALRLHYDRARLALLLNVLLTTPNGYRAGDIRFLIGAIYWKRGRTDDALQSWQHLPIDPDDVYFRSYSRLLPFVRPAGRKLNTREINRILEFEEGRWVSFSFDRLRQFGYRFDTF